MKRKKNYEWDPGPDYVDLVVKGRWAGWVYEDVNGKWMWGTGLHGLKSARTFVAAKEALLKAVGIRPGKETCEAEAQEASTEVGDCAAGGGAVTTRKAWWSGRTLFLADGAAIGFVCSKNKNTHFACTQEWVGGNPNNVNTYGPFLTEVEARAALLDLCKVVLGAPNETAPSKPSKPKPDWLDLSKQLYVELVRTAAYKGIGPDGPDDAALAKQAFKAADAFFAALEER